MLTRKLFRGASLQAFHEQIGNFGMHVKAAMSTEDDKECERLLNSIGNEMIKAGQQIRKLIKEKPCDSKNG